MNIVLPADANSEIATTWLRELIQHFGLSFHLDTAPEDYVLPNGQACFTPEECRLLGESLLRLFALLGDERPYEVSADRLSSLLAESHGWKPPLHYHDLLFQRWLLREGTREDIIDWLCWNDPNGTYTDRDSLREEHPPLTLSQAREILRKQIEPS